MLYLTYYTGHNDGFGAQFQRILGIYSICKKYNIEIRKNNIFSWGSLCEKLILTNGLDYFVRVIRI